MMFKGDAALYSYEVVRDSGENVMYVNYLGDRIVPSLVDFSEVMGRTIDALREESNIARIVFVQQRNYSYDFSQVRMLQGVAALVTFLMKQERIVSSERLSGLGEDYEEAYVFLNRILLEIGRYMERFFVRILCRILLSRGSLRRFRRMPRL